jgi:hypothetical protein
MLAQWQRGMAVVEHMHVLAQAQKVRYGSVLQPFNPGVADEFAIARQRSHGLIRERCRRGSFSADFGLHGRATPPACESRILVERRPVRKVVSFPG